MLTEVQVSALEKKQDGLSFTIGNTHAFITGSKGWVWETWYFRRCVHSVARDINDTGRAVGSSGTGLKKDRLLKTHSLACTLLVSPLGATGVGRKPLPSREKVGNGWS